ncbi:MAG: hypothetical protein WCO26_14995 [Deltaproteobacteria bacterium]
MQTTAAAKAQETYKKMCEDARNVDYQAAVMIEYESKLPKITPAMASWWWDNMGPIERYRLWSPEHLDFQWEIDTVGHGRFGAIHSVTEYVGEIPVYLRLRYEDPANYPGSRKYKHAIVESSLTHDDRIMGWILHEFDEVGDGLIMRNVFQLPLGTPKEIIDGIIEHSNKEMAKLPEFLPGLYAKALKK